MKRILTLSLAALTLVATLAGCAGKPTGSGTADTMTPEDRATLYSTAITAARNEEDNKYLAIVTKPDEAADLMGLMGLTAEDATAFALSASMMNTQAYGIAAVMPAADKAEAVKTALQGYIDSQKQSFDKYLMDQYEIAGSAKLETLSDGTILLVMCEGQDEVFSSIQTAIEAGK